MTWFSSIATTIGWWCGAKMLCWDVPHELRSTSAIPNSQSLVSRWHLPQEAVVCPLAEAPNMVSIIQSEQLQSLKQHSYTSYVQISFSYLELLFDEKWLRRVKTWIMELSGIFVISRIVHASGRIFLVQKLAGAEMSEKVLMFNFQKLIRKRIMKCWFGERSSEGYKMRSIHKDWET